MAKSKITNLTIDAHAINYARIASPVAKFETNGKDGTELEWKADLLIDEDTVEKIESTYPNLRKKMNPITAKKYEKQYNVKMPKGVEGPAILKLTQDVQVKFKDKKTGEDKLLDKPQPKALLKEGGKKARDITFEEYIGNGSVGKVIILHRITQYNGKPIDVLELGSVLITDLVEVEQKPGDKSTGPDLKDAFGIDEIEESDAEAPEPNESGFSNDDFDDDGEEDEDEQDDY